MPIYEYICPQHGKFEVIKCAEERESNLCPSCNQICKLIPSRFTHYWYNPFTVDGEGFTSKYVRNEEADEMDRAVRER